MNHEKLYLRRSQVRHVTTRAVLNKGWVSYKLDFLAKLQDCPSVRFQQSSNLGHLTEASHRLQVHVATVARFQQRLILLPMEGFHNLWGKSSFEFVRPGERKTSGGRQDRESLPQPTRLSYTGGPPARQKIKVQCGRNY